MASGNYATMPIKQQLSSTRNHISFTSVSSNESATNTSLDTVDAAPLRIQRMPLLSEDYIKQRQASVENLLANKTPTQSSRLSHYENLIDKSSSLDKTFPSKLSASKSHDFKKMNIDPDPYSYFEMRKKKDYVSFVDGHAKSKTDTSNTTRRMRSVSESDHSEPVSLPIDAFTKNTGQIDGRYLPKNSKNHSNPNLSSHLESDDECREYGFTETDLVANRQPRPSKPYLKGSENQNNDQEVGQIEEDKQGTVGPVSTPPRNVIYTENNRVQENESSNCCSGICMSVCCALVQWKHLFDRFSVWDISVSLVSIGIFLFDVMTDLTLAATYYTRIEDNERYRFYFGLTLGLVIGPSVIIQFFSYFWVIDDFLNKRQRERKALNKEYIDCKPKHVIALLVTFVIHFFQLAVLFRYFRGILYGFKSRYYECVKKEKYRDHFDSLWRYEVHDINMLRLLESFLESAPQLVLQIYIVLMTKQVHLITVISCTGSLLALSTVMVSIQRAIRNSNEKKNQLSIPASIVMFCWRACTISSRVVAFGLFLTIQPLAFLVFIILHWLAATVWIAWRGTNFCTKKAAEYFFDGICGLIYVFCFFNVHEEIDGRNSRSRWRMLVFYTVVLIENSVLSILWYFFRPGGHTGFPFGILSSTISNETIVENELIPTKSAGIIQTAHALGILVAVHVFFMLGIFFMVVYYSALHPKRSSLTCCCFSPKTLAVENSGTTLVSAPAGRYNPNVVYSPVPCSDPASTPAGVVLMTPMASGNADPQPRMPHSLQRQIDAKETLRKRRQSDLSESENSDLEFTSKTPWSETIFNRGKRARKLYTRQYSREKELDQIEELIPVTDVINKRYSPRRTDRYKTVVTPTRGENQTVFRSPIQWIDPNQSPSQSSTVKTSIVIKPGSQTLKPAHSAPRSATHLGLQYHTLTSPKKTTIVNPSSSLHSSPTKHLDEAYKFSANKVPPSVGGRDYSASMSCLMSDKPLSYAARRRQVLNLEVPRTPSFTITATEVIECMESSV